MKYKTLAILALLIALVFGSGITYSVFHSNASLSGNQGIAQFIFKTEKTNHLELPLFNLNPGDSKDYEFSVSNNSENSISHVTIEYQIIIQTYHFMPLDIKLYKIVDDTEELIMTCDEKYTRNEENALVCNSEVQEMSYIEESLDNYIIKVEFPAQYNDIEYSDLVDYIDITIKSWQKTGK